MELKVEQRKHYKLLRKNFDVLVKEKLDINIFEKVINTDEFKNCKSILIYITMGFEVDTLKIIEYAQKVGKDIYVPFVTNKKRVMKFYKFTSLDDLVLNKFGTLEPKEIDQWIDQNNTLCIVPALAYDLEGYRIGYGGGYYDYFLLNNFVNTIGIIYDDFIINKVYIDEHDQKVMKIITDKRIINT